MPRPLWKGAISFGLVSIPVELHTAVRDTRPHFRMLHVTDKSPVRFERVCIRDGKPVAWQDLVKGYEIEKGHFVVLTKDDFKAAALEKTQTVDIMDFVKAEEIDDRFFEVPYYLTLPAKTDIRRQELEMAKSLVDSLAAGWDPSKYTDQYRENLMKIIKAKSKGKKVALEAGEEKRPAEVVDLMERLRQSLAHTKAKPAKATTKTDKTEKRHRHTRRRSVA